MHTKIFRDKLYSTIIAFQEDEEDLKLHKYSDWLIDHKEQLPYLYRYSKADYYNIHSLETKTLSLSPIGEMNDIFEGLAYEINPENIGAEKRLKDIAYIKSFSEKHDDLRMWGIYADNYSGMCVKYNIRKLNE